MTHFFVKQNNLVLGLALGMALLLASCGGNASSQAGGTTSSGSSSSTSGSSSTNASHSGNATVHISQPYTADYTGGSCTLNGKSLLLVLKGASATAANFTFTIGPDPLQSDGSQVTYHGAGTYANVTITAFDPNHPNDAFLWPGTVTVKSDNQTGTFTATDPAHNGAGTFDCGQPMNP